MQTDDTVYQNQSQTEPGFVSAVSAAEKMPEEKLLFVFRDGGAGGNKTDVKTGRQRCKYDAGCVVVAISDTIQH